MTGAILAGGRSSRMGADKALLPLGSVPLIQWMLMVIKPLFDNVIVVCDYVDRFAFLDAKVYSDSIPDKGALGGILTALEYSESDWCFVLAVDMPLARREMIRKIIRFAEQADRKCDVVIPRKGEFLEPLFACYHKRCIPFIKDYIGQGGYKIKNFFDAARVCEIPLSEFKSEDPEQISLLNINTPEDYERALSHLDLGGLA